MSKTSNMKYIRTKDGIFRIKATPQSNAIYSGSQTYCIYDHIEMVDRDIIEKDIIKQADTIEELCDEFYLIDPCFEKPRKLSYTEYKTLKLQVKEHKWFEGKKTSVKGAIWTDKGLIFVAKMNDKGELKLL